MNDRHRAAFRARMRYVKKTTAPEYWHAAKVSWRFWYAMQGFDPARLEHFKYSLTQVAQALAADAEVAEHDED
ncbi:hypothetical protein [Lacticaseibacillus salsurivasis]|uniref:hypothetical protein n=1 Tax=Lacticaseibacillus salsurivasis TaxID=3081441 RepID=UPI0030C67590